MIFSVGRRILFLASLFLSLPLLLQLYERAIKLKVRLGSRLLTTAFSITVTVTWYLYVYVYPGAPPTTTDFYFYWLSALEPPRCDWNFWQPSLRAKDAAHSHLRFRKCLRLHLHRSRSAPIITATLVLSACLPGRRDVNNGYSDSDGGFGS